MLGLEPMTLNMLSKQSASERDPDQHVVILHGESGAGLPDRVELVILHSPWLAAQSVAKEEPNL